MRKLKELGEERLYSNLQQRIIIYRYYYLQIDV